jgi:hypothetical protein
MTLTRPSMIVSTNRCIQGHLLLDNQRPADQQRRSAMLSRMVQSPTPLTLRQNGYERVLSEWMCISLSPRRESTCYLARFVWLPLHRTTAAIQRRRIREPLTSQLSQRSVRSTPSVGSSPFYACDKNVI